MSWRTSGWFQSAIFFTWWRICAK